MPKSFLQESQDKYKAKSIFREAAMSFDSLEVTVKQSGEEINKDFRIQEIKKSEIKKNKVRKTYIEINGLGPDKE